VTASIPLLGILGQSCADMQQRAESAGFDAVLLRPVTATTVAQFGRLLVERASLLRERSARLLNSAASASRRSAASSRPPLPGMHSAEGATASSLRAPVAPRCRGCGSNADSRLVRTTASSSTYACGACHAEWRVSSKRR
jgi:hypothetical protein